MATKFRDLDIDLNIQDGERTLILAHAVVGDDDAHNGCDAAQELAFKVADAKRARARGDAIAAFTFSSLAAHLAKDVRQTLNLGDVG